MWLYVFGCVSPTYNDEILLFSITKQKFFFRSDFFPRNVVLSNLGIKIFGEKNTIQLRSTTICVVSNKCAISVTLLRVGHSRCSTIFSSVYQFVTIHLCILCYHRYHGYWSWTNRSLLRVIDNISNFKCPSVDKRTKLINLQPVWTDSIRILL